MPLLASLLGSLFDVKPTNDGDKTLPPANASTLNTSAPVQTPTQTPVTPPVRSAPVPTSRPTINTNIAASAPVHQQSNVSAEQDTSLVSARAMKQFGLFCGGASFLMLSIFISRRAINRHQAMSVMKFYSPNQVAGRNINNAPPESRDPLLAAQALNLATLNVVSFGVMMVGGVSWGLNISSLEELRMKSRTRLEGLGVRTDIEAEREVAEWMAKTLGIKIPEGSEGSGSDAAAKET